MHHTVHCRKLVHETGRGQVDDMSKNHPSRRNLGKTSGDSMPCIFTYAKALGTVAE